MIPIAFCHVLGLYFFLLVNLRFANDVMPEILSYLTHFHLCDTVQMHGPRR